MDTKITTHNFLSGRPLEEPRLQEQFQLLLEDHSKSAEQILSEQKTQGSGTILFVP